MTRLVCAAVSGLLAVALSVAATADGAAPNVKLKVTGPASTTAASSASFALTVTSRQAKPLKGLRAQALLSVDKRADRRDLKLGKAVALPAIKGRKSARKALRVSIPAAVPPSAYHLLVCVGPARPRKKDKPACTSAPLKVVPAAGPVKPVGPAPRPAATPQPSVAPPSPAPAPTPDPTPEPTPDPTPPAPGPALAAAPDPAEVAPPLPKTDATSVAKAAEFLYEGSDAIQQGVPAGTMEPEQLAVLRGRVTDRDGTGIAGVKVSVADHGEGAKEDFGHTATRADGGYDIAVNGGAPLTLVFERAGFIPAQRLVDAPWQDFTDVDPMVMVRYDGKETDIDTSGPAPYTVAKGSTVSDGQGSRTATLLFEKGTDAAMEVGAGRSKRYEEVRDLDVRATEYTQDSKTSGLAAMPGQLPPNTAFTYAAEFSVDEAVEAGATDVKFSKPVVSYTDNFLELPPGTLVPTGYYDREKEAWVGSRNGIVLEVLADDNAGAATFNLDADPEADPDLYAGWGIDDAERTRVSSLYEPGKQLWRVEIGHFTPWDYNMPYGPDGDAGPPGTGGPSGGNGDGGPGDCGQSGSLILCDSQVLGEMLPITGTGMDLVYRSDRVPGRTAERRVEIPLVEGELRAGVQSVELEISVAGQRHVESFPRAEILGGKREELFVWDGKDAYGRPMQGSQRATVRVGHTYKAVYQQPQNFQSSWAGLSGLPISGSRARQEYTVWQEDEVTLGTVDTSGIAMGGWTLSSLHAYDPVSRKLVMGDGSQRDTDASTLTVLDHFAGNRWGYGAFSGDEGPAAEAGLDSPHGVAHTADGELLVADTANNRIRRIGRDGTIRTIAGTGSYGLGGDGGAAAAATLSLPRGIAAAEDGTIYVADTGANRVRRISPAGTITTIAGGGRPATGVGDGGPATEARLSGPSALALAPDGALYIADTWHHRVRVVGTDGVIRTVAGTGAGAFSGDGGPAADAALRLPQSVAVDADGRLLVSDTGNHRVRAIGIDGVITTIAGGGNPAEGIGDGGLATAAQLVSPVGVAATRDGALLVVDAGNLRVRRIETDGTIRTVVGGAGSDPNRNGRAATAARLSDPLGIAVAPDGAVYIAERAGHRVRRAALLMEGFADGDTLIASEDGTRIYQFNSAGRHERTRDALTNATIHHFNYDAQGRLASVTDPDSDRTTDPAAPLLRVVRDGAGNPTELVARGGRTTTLAQSADGWLTRFTNPAGEAVRLSYAAGGLLTSLIDPRGSTYTFAYDPTGRLLKDTGPVASKTLERTELERGREITLTTSGGRTWVYRNERLATGDAVRTVTDPSGATTTTTRRTDGTVEVVEPDGTVRTVRAEPDPRFGMQAPVAAREEVRTPAGRVHVTERSRTVEAPTITDLQSQTDTIRVNGKTTTIRYARDGNPGDAVAGVVEATSPAGRRTRTTLDTRGREIEVAPDTAAGTHHVLTTYADDGSVTAVEVGARSWTYGYDAQRRVVKRMDAQGHAVHYAYDGLSDRIARIGTSASLTAGNSWRYEYDAAGNATRVTLPTPEGATARVYDLTSTADNLPDTMSVPGGGTYDRDYTADRELLSRQLPSGVEELYSYNAGAQLVGVRTPQTSASYTYEPTPAADDGTTDNVDVATWDRASGGSEQRLSGDYDGPLPTAVAFSGRSTGSFAYTPNADLQVSSWSVTAAGETRTFAIGRDSDQRLEQIGPYDVRRNSLTGAAEAFVDGLARVDVAHDGYGDLAGRTVTHDTTERYKLEVERDEQGQIATRREWVDGTLTTHTYGYDDQDRLATVTRDGTLVESYAYDASGNRTAVTPNGGAAKSVLYDTQDRVTDYDGTAYSWDADGYLTRRGDDTFAYGRRGELLRAVVGGETITYDYDAYGRRVRRAAPSGDTQYLYGNPDDAMQVTASVSAGVLTVYHYDEHDALRALERGGRRYAVGSDQVGSPRVVVDDAGAIVKRVDYDAWGRATDANPEFPLAIGFAGGIADARTGLVRFGMRDYDPVVGRWTARDPSYFTGSPLNLYAYVNNDPQSLRDPSGLICLGGSFYLGIGGGLQFCADANGVGVCAEGGVGLGAGVEVDALEGPENSDSTVAELTAGFKGIASVTVGVEVGDCGDTKLKTTTGVAGVEGGLSTTVGADGKTKRAYALKGGVGFPLPVSGKLARKSCRAMSF